MSVWTDEMKAELANLFHLAATALAGKKDTDGSDLSHSRYRRMQWAAAEYEKLHPEVSSTAAYKQLDREDAWRWAR